jgi:hypothetical protein
MRDFRFFLLLLACFFSLNAHAGLELVCSGGSARSANKVVNVDCSDRQDFIKKLGGAWQLLRKNSIAGPIEDMCWKAFNEAKEMHPSISFVNISDAFLARCNMGLDYVK